MIAKASTISHGANAIRYSVNKDRTDTVKANLLPDDISPEAMYGRMMLVQKMFAEKINKGRPLGRNVIRIEISPAEEESQNWKMDDWVHLANEFIHVFDHRPFREDQASIIKTDKPQRFAVHRCLASGFQKWYTPSAH